MRSATSALRSGWTRMTDPKPTGACAVCEKPLTERLSRNSRGDGGTKLPSSIWLANLEADPFCSSDCCREYHHVPTARRIGSEHRCAECGTTFATRSHDNIFCNDKCRQRADRRRRRTRRGPARHGFCVGCSVPYHEYTAGCIQCRDRSLKHRKREADPEFREKERSYWEARKARHTARERERRKTDPEYRARMNRAQHEYKRRKAASDPDYLERKRAKDRENWKRRMEDPAFREKQRLRQQARREQRQNDDLGRAA